ncbi:hypothetical protein N499_1265B, partial [Wolbachia pipientis wVitA]
FFEHSRKCRKKMFNIISGVLVVLICTDCEVK